MVPDNKIRVKKVRIVDIQQHPLQPEWRAENKNLEALAQDIKEKGLLSLPEVVYHEHKYYLVDGHRRIAALRLLKQLTVTVQLISSDVPFELTLGARNKHVRLYSGPDYFYSWYKSKDRTTYLKSLSTFRAAQIREMIKTFGLAEAERLARERTNPTLVNQISVASSFLARWDLPNIAAQRNQIGYWLLKHKGQALVRALARAGTRSQANQLANSIKQDTAFLQRGAKRARLQKETLARLEKAAGLQ